MDFGVHTPPAYGLGSRTVAPWEGKTRSAHWVWVTVMRWGGGLFSVKPGPGIAVPGKQYQGKELGLQSRGPGCILY